MLTKIILLSGPCYSGKTFIKNSWLKKNDARFQWFGGAFASALKDEMHDLALIDKTKLKDPAYKASVRTAMQEYGQTRRRQEPMYWAAKLAEAIGDPSNGGVYVVDDWRFLNEARHLEDAGFYIVKCRVIRPVELMAESVGIDLVREYLEVHNKDVSERELSIEYASNPSYFDYTIYNGEMGSGHLLPRLYEIERNLP